MMKLLFVLIEQFIREMNQSTNEDRSNFKFFQHKGVSIILNACYPNSNTIIGPNNSSDKLVPIAGLPTVESLSGANGVPDILSTVRCWDFSSGY